MVFTLDYLARCPGRAHAQNYGRFQDHTDSREWLCQGTCGDRGKTGAQGGPSMGNDSVWGLAINPG